MKKIVVFCLFAAALAMAQAQKQRVAVLPTEADSELKWSEKQLDMLTNRVRSIASEILPNEDFILLKQDFVRNQLGDSAYHDVCSENCFGSLMDKVQANFGARVDVFAMNNKLWLKFELYGTLIGDTTAGMIYIIPDTEVKDLEAMLALLDKRVPEAFKKILPTTPTVPVVQIPVAPVASGNYVAQIVTEPAGASLLLNGSPYQACPRTPCVISLYENRVKLAAMLDEHHTTDTSLVITMPNQLVSIKLNPKTYAVNFTSEPSGASVSFDGGTCVTPCPSRFFKKGKVKVHAKFDMYESIDTVIFVSGAAIVNLKLNPTFGTLAVKPSEGWNLGNARYLPGTHNIKLSHKCNEDVNFSVDIKKGEQAFVDFSDKVVPKKSELDLQVKYKGRIQNESVWVNGEQVGQTPFSGTVPLCSDIAWGAERQKIDVNLKHNEKAEYTHRQSTAGATALGVLLDVAGAFFLWQALDQSSKATDYGKKYDNLTGEDPAEYSDLKDKSKDATKKANMFLIIGGVSIAASVGVYLWF